MKKLLVFLLMAVLCSTFLSISASAEPAFNVTVYNTEGEGLALKASADINSTRLAMIPENTILTIVGTSNGWGYTIYNNMAGWVFLQYTKVYGNASFIGPSWGFITPTAYVVSNTGREGLELRSGPTKQSSSFGAVPDGTMLNVTAINNDWAYTCYNEHYGWLNLTYLRLWVAPAPGAVTTTYYYVTVYNTEGEGLALKEKPDINAKRILMIPDGTPLTIDFLNSSGWGHTTYNGKDGYVSVRYTKVLGSYPTLPPSKGLITPKYYTVYRTGNEGLEIRTWASLYASSFGAIPDGTSLLVSAINGSWGFTSYNGNNGWVYMDYLR